VLALPECGAPGDGGANARALVLDTNIVLDLLVFADAAMAPVRTLLDAQRLCWVATPPMRDELARVLAYPQIVPRLAFYGLQGCRRPAFHRPGRGPPRHPAQQGQGRALHAKKAASPWCASGNSYSFWVFVKVCGRREVLTMAHTVYRS
jgi:hypothetical protein